MSLTIRACGAVIQDPSDSRVYQFDWDALNLPVGVTITTSTWTITAVEPSTATLMTSDNEAIVTGSRKTTARLQGGTLGAKYNIANKIVTNESPAQTKEQSFDVLIQNR